MDRFVPTAGEPGTYGQTPRKDVLEYRLLYGAMMQTSFASSMDRWHVQGLYVITPSGKLLAGGHTVSHPDKVALEMDQGLERYEQRSREERLLPKAPDPARDRVPPRTAEVQPPVDGLILRHEADPSEMRPELSGHFHPKLRLQVQGRSVSRRCFVISETKMILPAFGSLTGGLDAAHPEIMRSVGGAATALVPISDRLLRFPLAA